MKEEDKDNAYGAVALLLLMPILIPVGSAVKAFVIMKLWLWLMVPMFGFSPITFWPAMGLGLFASFLTFQTQHGKTDPWELLGSWVGTIAITYPITLGIGWIISKML